MNLHLPRRYRRKLLFPPGLLALAGLLWLGSVAVGSWRERLKPRYVIRVTMPLRAAHRNSEFLRFFEVPNPDTVCKSCNWKDAFFVGNTIADRQEQVKITRYVHSIVTDTKHAAGIRIRFMPTARYASLVFSLNLMNEQGVKKYWLDIIRSPTTFYVITDVYKPRIKKPKTNIEMAPAPILLDDVIYSQPQASEKRLMNSRIARWQLRWIQPLEQPEWRASLWLLAAIVTLSGWRIIRAWRLA